MEFQPPPKPECLSLLTADSYTISWDRFSETRKQRRPLEGGDLFKAPAGGTAPKNATTAVKRCSVSRLASSCSHRTRKKAHTWQVIYVTISIKLNVGGLVGLSRAQKEPLSQSGSDH